MTTTRNAPSAPVRMTVSQLVAHDERAGHYMAEGSFGYLHHAVRDITTDALVEQLVADAGYSREEFVGLLVSKMGRWLGDELTWHNAVDRARQFITNARTRAYCIESARLYWDEYRAAGL